MVINKFTGARGKSGSNDANAEYLAHLRHIFDKAEVNFQTIFPLPGTTGFNG